MAKKKKKNILGLLILFLLGFCIVIWGLVACQKGLSLSFYTNEPEPVEQMVETTQEVTVEVTEFVTEEEPATIEEPETTEEPVSETEATTEAEPQGADSENEFDPTIEGSVLSNESLSWSFKRNGDHLPVTGYTKGIDMESYGAYYKVDTEEKVIYLTFDEGYENGHTSDILDILKANDVQAAFFVTKPYITSEKELCIRMKEEGHLVANHSVTHSRFSTLADEEIAQELLENEQTFQELIGYSMDQFFRPPAGEYSERVLYQVRKAGYRTIFWSLAYKDWDVNNQPGKEAAYQHVMDNHHPGGIFLLHAVSESNTLALDEILKALKAEGYRFGSLYEVE